MNTIKFLAKRLKEPSTYAGVAAALAAFAQFDKTLCYVAAAAAVLAALLKEGAPAEA